MFSQHLGDAIGQAAYPVGAEAKGASTADTGQFVHYPAQSLTWRQGSRHAQRQADQATNRFADGADVAARFAHVEEDLERFLFCVAVDGDIGAAQRRLFAVGIAL